MNKNTPPHSLTLQQGYIGLRTPASGAQDSALLAGALDEIACGLIIMDGQARLLHCNLAGRLQLERATSLQLNGERVQTVQNSDAARLQEALTKASTGKRSMLTLGAQAQSTVAVVPLDRHQDHGAAPAGDAAHGSPSPHGPRIALIFSRSGMCEALMMSFFARAYQLTRAEEQILSMLCIGHTAPEMARELRVGEATVRTHIRSICQKTHSHGIREVVKRLALLPPLMAAVMPSAFA